MNTCYTHIDQIMSSFPNYFCDSESSDDVNDNGDTDEYINTEDDASINTDLVSKFRQIYWIMVVSKRKYPQADVW